MSRDAAALGEFDLIGRYFSRSARPNPARPDVVLGVGDDAALLRIPAGMELVAAVDTLVAGRHFPSDASPQSIGYRALAVNLSDMAAMGAQPRWATLALTLPAADPAWLQPFSQGFMGLADQFGVVLVGGDTTGGPLTISVQILGLTASGTALRRSGARQGDLLVVTGSLGDAAAGLAIVSGVLAVPDPGIRAELVRRFEYPVPRVEFGLAAVALASAAMDLSDGLAGDLPKLAAASGVAALVDVSHLPLSAALRTAGTPQQCLGWALSGGDDYELLLAVPPQRAAALAAAARQVNVELTVIGELRRGNGVTWTQGGIPLAPPSGGFDHFR